MKKSVLVSRLWAFCMTICLANIGGTVALAQVVEQRIKEPVDYVNPNIGGIGHLLTSLYPEVQVPHGVATIAPVVGPTVTDVYLAQEIYGFRESNSVLTATTGPVNLKPDENASEIDHDKEVVTPYYSSYLLDTFAIRVEYSVASHAMYYRFSFPGGGGSHLLLRPTERAEYSVESPTLVTGTDEYRGVRTYFYLELSHPVESHRLVVENRESGDPSRASGTNILLVLNCGTGPEIREVRVGVSYISIEQAKRNLQEEIPGWNFAATKKRARAAWNRSLSKILVQGGSEDQRTIFYTALYRCFQHLKDITEDGRHYGPYDHRVHDADGQNFYIDDNLWDTYRSWHPLQAILEPRQHQDAMQSYVRMYEETGWMPVFPFMSGDLPFMIGNHIAPVIADSYFKGERGFDVEKAYEGIRKNATQATLLPDTRGPATEIDRFYFEHGYFPALNKGEAETVKEVNHDMRRQAVSVTLENAYDDWAIAELAKALGKKEDAEYFGKRALNYRNVFNPQIGYMAPKNAAGQFIEGYDPKWGGGQAGRDYFTECNGLVYTFHVQHDVAGLIQLMGGREKFLTRLDFLFSDAYDGRYKFEFLAQFPDSTGLIGQYPQGDEPSFHIPYLYNYAGAPWKTQKKVRDIMQVWYTAQPLGLPGDEDNGAISSWYVFSALGFYPVSPGRPVYDIGSPIFREARIQVGEGKTFRVVARNVSARNKYIQSAELNGKLLNKPWFQHSDLVRGGSLVLQMGPLPNKNWGSAPDAAPPSLSH